MAKDARFAYLQARLQARHGDRPSPDDWRIAESSSGLSHYLEAVRRTPLKRWVGDLNHEMEPAAMERLLRATWRETVDQVADWSPEEWRPAVRWLRWLPDLPAIDHLLRGAKVPPWMRADPVMRELAFDELPRRREALAESPLAPLCPEENQAHATGRGGLDPGTAAPAARLGPRSRRRARADSRGRTQPRRGDARQRGPRRHRAAQPAGDAPRATLPARRRHRGRAVLAPRPRRPGARTLRAGIMARRLLPERAEGRSWA
jgi:hypothetical protein